MAVQIGKFIQLETQDQILESDKDPRVDSRLEDLANFESILAKKILVDYIIFSIFSMENSVKLNTVVFYLARPFLLSSFLFIDLLLLPSRQQQSQSLQPGQQLIHRMSSVLHFLHIRY